MLKLLRILLFILTVTAPGYAGELVERPIYWDYQEFAAIKALVPDLREARLCGLNKLCMRLWRDGEMQVSDHGMVVRGDFNGDGSPDIGVCFEKDREKEPGLDYCMVLASRPKGEPYKLLQVVPFDKANSIVECYWDPEDRLVMVDLGERQLITESTVTMEDGVMVGGLRRKQGAINVVYSLIAWNAHDKKFVLKKAD